MFGPDWWCFFFTRVHCKSFKNGIKVRGGHLKKWIRGKYFFRPIFGFLSIDFPINLPLRQINQKNEFRGSTYFSLLISFIFVTSMSLQSCTKPVNVLSNCPIVWNDLHIWKKWHKIFPLFWVLKYNHATLVVDVVDPGQDKLEKLKDFCGCLTIWFNIGSLLSNQCRHGFLIIIIAFLQSNPRSSLPPSSFIFNILLFIQNPAVLAFIIHSWLHQYLV